MLDLVAISRALGADAGRFDVCLMPVCDSTNAVLLTRAEAGAPKGTVVVAAAQTDGRGRRGRTWVSSPGDSLIFSLLWRFAPGTLPVGLPLVVGVAVTNALAKVGVGSAALKWPNDVLIQGRKLAGILVELVPGTPHEAVIGIGLNLRLPAALPEEIRSLAAALDRPVDENILLASLLIELDVLLANYAFSGFAGLREAWLARHAYNDMPVVLLSDFSPPREGFCRGVDLDGALLLETGGRVERILSGEVSLRKIA